MRPRSLTLGSRNGTTVEGVGLAPGEAHALQPGEIVQAGRTLLGVTAPDEDPHHGVPTRSVPFNRQPRVQRPLTETIFPVAGAPRPIRTARGSRSAPP